ncbi:MAG: class I SAM-dependent methyltransferase [Bryobacter sp.]|nr:class I SAM-dependent methyltransferase [Bryobacter sp.]
MLRLDPVPTPAELISFYPKPYWQSAEQSSQQSAVTALEQNYRRLVAWDHIAFLDKAATHSKPAEGRAPLVMDVGCGGGLLLSMMRERGHRVLGLDFSLDAAAIAWRENLVPAVCGSLVPAPLPDASVSTLSMFHLLEHLYEPQRYLEEAHRLLAPGGCLVVQVPNADSWTALLFGESWNGYDVPRHLQNFRLRDLEILLDQCGFAVVRVKHFSLRDNPAGFAISLAPSLDPMARKVWNPTEAPAERFWKNLAHLALIGLALPFSALEALCRAGSTVMVEARKKA